jgi:transporter family protein
MISVYIALLGRILLLGYEKIVVKKLSSGVRSESSAFLYFFIAALSLIPTLFFTSWPIHFKFLIPLTISSIVYGVAYLFYVKALSTGDASLVAPLYNLSLLFLLLFTTIFLGEKLSFTKITGILLRLYGASLLGEGKNLIVSIKNLTQDKAPLYMILASF